MIAEIISIGDELSSGQRLDTNSQWLSQRLADLGVRVMYHTTVADALEPNVQVFRAAIDRADVVVSTGGLGPTADDLTREALAAVTGTQLELDEASLEHIRGLFARHRREMPERNRLQAMFPAGSRPIFNPRGTAPGIDLVARKSLDGSCRVFALPGVPAEMFEMFACSVGPAVQAMLPEARVIVHRRIKCFGAGESQIEQMLPDLIRRGREPSVGITASAATITLRVTAQGASVAECEAAMRPTIETIRQCLGNLVYGEEDDELHDVVARRLARQGSRLAVVDAGADGQLAAWLSEANRALDAAGSRLADVFAGGLTLGGVDSLAVLGLDPDAWRDEPARLGPGFVRVAAEACRVRFGADYALAIGFFPAEDAEAEDAGAESRRGAASAGSGAAEPGSAPEYHFALASPAKVVCHSGTLISHPSIWKVRAAKQALNLLRLNLRDEA